VRNLPDGDFEVTLRVTNPGWLRSTLIQLAPYVRSVAPRSLADDVAGAAREALDVYGATSATRDGATSRNHH